MPEGLLAEAFRRAVLGFLVRQQALSEELCSRMLGWRYSGFSAHNQVRVGEHDPEGRKKLAGYMLRAPMSLEKMTYEVESGTVIYRSKMHLGLKRNFQVMPGAEWLELLLRHIPDRYEHLVRYVGLVLEPRARRAGDDSEGPGCADHVRSAHRTRERVRLACQGRLGAAHSQGVRGRPARVSQVQGADAGHRA